MVDEQPLTVIGVAAPGFHGVEVEHQADVRHARPGDVSCGNIMATWCGHWVWIPRLGSRPEIPRRAGFRRNAVDVIMRQHLLSVYGDQPDTAFRRWAMEQKIGGRHGGSAPPVLREQFGKPLD